MDPLESAYWWGARDAALLELNELTSIDAPLRVRQRSLEIFLAVAERGSRGTAAEMHLLLGPGGPFRTRSPPRLSSTSRTRKDKKAEGPPRPSRQ
jgi:hypothetical protein